MRRDLGIRLRVALRRRLPGGRRLQRALVRGDLRGLTRLEPISGVFGLDRGTPIDRWHIERHLAAHATDIRGHVAEIGDDHYTRAFGRGVTEATIIDVDSSNGRATLIADLESGTGVPAAVFDCVILTQVLMFTYDVRAALRHVAASLRPGGVVLGSVSGISQISDLDAARTGDFWRFTGAAMKRLVSESFEEATIDTFGNVVTATAFLNGLAAEELTQVQLLHVDTRFPVVVTFRALAPAPDRVDV